MKKHFNVDIISLMSSESCNPILIGKFMQG